MCVLSQILQIESLRNLLIRMRMPLKQQSGRNLRMRMPLKQQSMRNLRIRLRMPDQQQSMQNLRIWMRVQQQSAQNLRIWMRMRGQQQSGRNLRIRLRMPSKQQSRRNLRLQVLSKQQSLRNLRIRMRMPVKQQSMQTKRMQTRRKRIFFEIALYTSPFSAVLRFCCALREELLLLNCSSTCIWGILDGGSACSWWWCRTLQSFSLFIGTSKHDGRPDVAELDQVTPTSDAGLASVDTINNDNILNEALAASSRVKKLSDVHSSVNQDTSSAQSQIKEIQEKLPATISAVTDLKARIENTTAVVEERKGKLAYLKEKVAVARDKDNRIKLGALFEVGSVLELPVTAPVDDFGSYTDAPLFFRTRRDTGLLLYFGNEARQSGVNEFIAVEVENRRPKLTFALGGKEPASITLDTEVTDHLWREIVVERVGKDATFKLTHPNSERFAEEKTVSVSGSKNVLNLYKDSMRLLLPSAVDQRHFVGDLDKLQVNGEHIGFWNSDKAEHIIGDDVRTVADSERQAESGVSFNGNGYMQLGVGAWNPRKRTAILLWFSTNTPDGLLFFMDKDRVLEFVTLQILNGTVKFSVDSSGDTESVVCVPPVDNAICDGHWHQIKLHKKKNLITLNVNGKSNLRIMKTKTETTTKDSLFLVGVPKDVKWRGLDTVDPYIGCVRVLSIGKNTRGRRRNVDLSSVELFGITCRTSCPLN